MIEEPPDTLTDHRELLLAYLDYYRAALLRKLDGLPEDDLRASTLPSGWAPLAMLKHLAFVERRWFRWGFAAEQVDEIWGEQAPGARAWHVRVGRAGGVPAIPVGQRSFLTRSSNSRSSRLGRPKRSSP